MSARKQQHEMSKEERDARVKVITAPENLWRPKNMYGRKKLGVDTYEAALQRIRHVRNLFDHIAVSFSGGKDSTVVLNPVLQVAHEDDWEHRFPKDWPIRVVHWDEEAIPYETEAYVRRIHNRPDVAQEWYCLPVKHRNACSPSSPWWYPWAPEDEDKWVRPLPLEAITELTGFPIEPIEERLSVAEASPLLFVDQYGEGRSSALLMGIRTQESLTRLKAIATRSPQDPYIKDRIHRMYAKVYPVYDWTNNDVWTAIAKQGWDYNEAYDAMEMAGVAYRDSRCAPPYGEEPLGSLWMFSQAFPDVWGPMSERVPGAAAAARYAKTELYAYRQRPKKRMDESYPDFILRMIDRFEEKERPFVANQCRTWMQFHYKRTRDPLAWDYHPETGVGWRLVETIAYRGDFKNRQSAVFGHSEKRARQLSHRYYRELRWRRWAGRLWELGAPGVKDDPEPPRADDVLEEGDLQELLRQYPEWVEERVALDGGGIDDLELANILAARASEELDR